jgi:selenide,water dikinase
VYKIRDDLAVIQTVDFFPPVVDDPYLYGQIAAANALSDIYAMGASPSFALNILCAPACLSSDTLRAIMEGGYHKVSEAGAVVAGGHSIVDAEPKYGMCVTGFIHPDKVWPNAGAKPGDVLILTKPLGSGVAVSAFKTGKMTPEEFSAATDVMKALNKYARDAIAASGVNACTDVTGFGLIGHACEMAAASGVTIEITAGDLPVLPGVLGLVEKGCLPGGAARNREHTKQRVKIGAGVSNCFVDIICDPQTSGGLFVSLPEAGAKEALPRLLEVTDYARIIGRVLPRQGEDLRII